MYLVRWLLFRMMFASGVVKLTSGCPTWWGLTAMPTHYFSQCIPTPLAWYARQLPDWLHRLSVAATFVIEIPLTALFFAPTAGLRKFTFIQQNFLMVVIMLSGNYNFFNFLFMALTLGLADDSWLNMRLLKQGSNLAVRALKFLFHFVVASSLLAAVVYAFNLKLSTGRQLAVESKVMFTEQQFDAFLAHAVPLSIIVGAFGLLYAVIISLVKCFKGDSGLRTMLNLFTVLLYTSVACSMFVTSLPSYTGQLDRTTYDQLPRVVKDMDRATARFQLTASYGLFRRMTGVGGRPEIVLEGSDSPRGPWREYEFLYKPGRLDAAPKFCLPHQPRLDWQMWFAALGG